MNARPGQRPTGIRGVQPRGQFPLKSKDGTEKKTCLSGRPPGTLKRLLGSPTPPLSPAPRSVPPKKRKRIGNTPAKGKADKNQDDIDAVGKAMINYFEERKKILKHENVQADADAAFCMSLQPLLKKLPLQKNLEAKIQIMTVIKNMTGSSQEDRSVQSYSHFNTSSSSNPGYLNNHLAYWDFPVPYLFPGWWSDNRSSSIKCTYASS